MSIEKANMAISRNRAKGLTRQKYRKITQLSDQLEKSKKLNKTNSYDAVITRKLLYKLPRIEVIHANVMMKIELIFEK